MNSLSLNKDLANETDALNEQNASSWQAGFSAKFHFANGKTRLGDTSHYGPLRVQRPFYPEGSECLHFYLLHPPGGLVGGDCLSIDLDLEEGSRVVMTTPSAGKIYRNISPLPQVQRTTVRADHDAVIEYLPQENIVFNGAKAEISTRVDLSGSGVFVGWEMTCLGLFENQGLFTEGSLRQSLELWRDDKPIFIDRLLLSAESGLLQSKAGLQGKTVFGTMLITADVASNSVLIETLVHWQEQINNAELSIAMTQKPGVFVVRALAYEAEPLRHAFQWLWRELRPAVLNREACAPRIWST